MSCYLSQSSEIYNDVQLNIDEEVYQTLLKHGLFRKEYFLY